MRARRDQTEQEDNREDCKHEGRPAGHTRLVGYDRYIRADRALGIEGAIAAIGTGHLKRVRQFGNRLRKHVQEMAALSTSYATVCKAPWHGYLTRGVTLLFLRLGSHDHLGHGRRSRNDSNAQDQIEDQRLDV